MQTMPVYFHRYKRLAAAQTAPVYGPSLLLLLAACGGGGSSPEPVTTGGVYVSGATAQAAPEFRTKSVEVRLDENSRLTETTSVMQAEAVVPGQAVRYSLAGDDAAAFAINSRTGEVTFARDTASDYEANPDGWRFAIVARSSYGREAFQQVRVKLNNLDEAGGIEPFTRVPYFGLALAAPSLTDPDGGVDNIRYQWQEKQKGKDWTDIEGATDDSITPSAEDVGKQFRVVIRYTDAQLDAASGQQAGDPDGPVERVIVSAQTEPVPGDAPPTAMAIEINKAPAGGTTIDEMNLTQRTELADLVFTDADGGLNPVVLSGPDAGLFAAEGGKLVLKAGASLDVDGGGKTAYQVTVTSVQNPALSASFTLTVTDINDEAPDITSAATGNALPENAAVPDSQILYTANATPDLSTDDIVWSLSGGDSALFSINSRSGAIAFKADTTPDFETNRDGYSFDVVATTRSGQADEQAARKTVTIAVTDADDAPSAMVLTDTCGDAG